MTGEINVNAMLRRITAKQFRDWEIYFELEPMVVRPDWRAASIVQTIFNMAVSKEDRKTLDHFLKPFITPADAPEDVPPEEMQKKKLAQQWNILNIMAQVQAVAEAKK